MRFFMNLAWPKGLLLETVELFEVVVPPLRDHLGSSFGGMQSAGSK